MKFTKAEAVEKLNQVLTNGGKKTLRMSARTLDGQTEALMSLIANEEMELDEFVEKIKGNLESINSNIEHDTSEAIKEYKEKNPIQQPKKDPPTDDPNEAIIKRLQELEQKEAERVSKAAIETKRSEVRKYLSDNNVKNTEWIDKALGFSNFTPETDSEALGKSLLEFYNSSIADQGPIVPVTPKHGDENRQGAYDDIASSRKRRAELEG